METKSEKLKALEILDDSEIADFDYDWEIPTPLQEDKPLPSFPIETLPPIIQNYAKAVAENTQTPIDMSAIASLAAVATAVQGKFEIQGKSDYIEPLNIYGVIIAKPAERKSAVMKKMTNCLYEYEEIQNRQRQTIIDEQTIKLNNKYNQINSLEKKKNSTDEDIEKAVFLQLECRELEEKQVHLLRLTADDCTSEALTSLLADNDGKMSIVSAEGGLFDIMAGKYTKGVSIDTFLKAHCGDPIRVDRKGREPEYVKKPTMTILLAIQENVLEGLMSNDIFRGRGLTARFLYCYPKSTVGTRKFQIDIELNSFEKAENEYKVLLYQLLDFPIENGPKILKLSDQAFIILEQFFNWIEKQLTEELEFIGDWAGKLTGTCLRIAGLLHLMDYSNAKNKTPVSAETMENAVIISKYFLEHSKYAYMIMGADIEMQRAKFILKKLKLQNKTILKRNEIVKMSRSKYIKKTQDIEQAINLLLEYGYIRELPIPEREGAGRKPDIKYQLNPLYFK